MLKLEKTLIYLFYIILLTPFIILFLLNCLFLFFVPVLQIKFFIVNGVWKSYSVIDFFLQADIFTSWALSPASYLGLHKILTWFSPIGFIVIPSLILSVITLSKYDQHRTSMYQNIVGHLSANGSGKEVCLTGFTSQEKNKFGELLADRGFKIRSSVTSNLRFLVTPSGTYKRSPSKEAEANRVGAEVVDLDSLLTNEL